MRYTEEERTDAVDHLREIYPKGSTVLTILRHKSDSGMSRVISVVQVDGDTVRDWSYRVARAVNEKFSERYDGVVVHGAGMDMGFDLVYRLATALYGDGYALEQKWV